MGTDDKRDRVEKLHAAVDRAKQRFTALQDAFNMMENAHKRGDYSPSRDLQRRIEEFRSAAAEVQRLATDSRSGSDSRPDAGRSE
jgi:hypothetical protein